MKHATPSSILLGLCLAAGFFFTEAPSVEALAPYEVLVLVNKNSAASMEVANHFIYKRNIPLTNVVYLDLPPPYGSPRHGITQEDFISMIWNPVLSALRERRLYELIQAWVYSADFPPFVRTSPPVSIQGMTFTHGRLPPSEQVSGGTFGSPLFASPVNKDTPVGASQSLSRYRAELGRQMPIPSMSLAIIGTARGNSVSEAIAVIDRGVASDHTFPKGNIYLVKNSNVRSKPRNWQYDTVARQLKEYGIKAIVSARLPLGDKPIFGLQTGTAHIQTEQFTRFLPGAMADHLTSFAGNFSSGQTKLTAWLAAGATASAGTVTEPKAIWTKFPHAAFYLHYARGCSMLESFYQAVASPHQLLMVGEPLARPFGASIPVKVKQQRENDDWRFTVETRGEFAKKSLSYRYILNDTLRSPRSLDPVLTVSSGQLTAGWHTLRVIVEVNEAVGHYRELILPFEVEKPGRGVALASVKELDSLAAGRPVALKARAVGNPSTIKLYKGLVEISTAAEGLLRFNPALLGKGPSLIQLYALYEDGEIVRSPLYPATVVEAVPEEDFSDGS